MRLGIRRESERVKYQRGGDALCNPPHIFLSIFCKTNRRGGKGDEKVGRIQGRVLTVDEPLRWGHIENQYLGMISNKKLSSRKLKLSSEYVSLDSIPVTLRHSGGSRNQSDHREWGDGMGCGHETFGSINGLKIGGVKVICGIEPGEL